MRYQWRLILDPPLPGKANMEKDLEIMDQVSCGECPPTLRIYRWSPPALSLGYFQDDRQVVNIDACKKRGIDVIRRPTGGRAILHCDELTYSIVVPEAHPFINKGGVIDAYLAISRGLVTAFNLLDIVASVVPENEVRPGLSPGSCFDTPSAYEIKIDGKKVVGSAQLRRDGIVLQHGAILFRLPENLYNGVLKPANHKGEGKFKLSDRASGLHDLGYNISYETMTRALVKAFSMVVPAVFSSQHRRL